MKTIFVLSILWSLALWVTVVYVPARSLYHSEQRTLFFQLVLDTVTYVLAARAILLWRGFEPMSVPWAVKPGNTTHQFFAWCFARFLIMCVFCVLLDDVSSQVCSSFVCCKRLIRLQANPGQWLLSSPCGASSCSTQIDTSAVVFNPNGFYNGAPGPTHLYTDFRPTTCVFSSCFWASDTNQSIIAYAPQTSQPGYPNLTQPCTQPGCLITGRSQDYPNPATGGGNGYFPGFGVSTLGQSAPCPGMYVDPVSLALKPLPPCAYCGPFFAKHYQYVTPGGSYCPSSYPNDPNAADNWFWCGYVCPGISEDRTPSAQVSLLSPCGEKLTPP